MGLVTLKLLNNNYSIIDVWVLYTKDNHKIIALGSRMVYNGYT
jgi:hypothetical protein